jgi:MFS superfamily sulfate permease-like transporter
LELFYANANRFAEEVNCLVGQAPSQVRWLIVDAEAITHLDYSAARVLLVLQQTLASCGTQLGFARMPWDLKSDFARHHVTEVVDPSLIFDRLHHALAGFREAGASLKICGSAIAPRVQLLRAQLRSAVPSDLERLQAVSDVAAR